MKNQQTASDSRIVTIRFKPEEYAQLQKKFRTSTCRKLSEYIRKVTLGKPMVFTYRNQSADDFLAEMVKLKNELNAIGNNFNQAVTRLHTLHQFDDMKAWIVLNEVSKQSLFRKIEEIKSRTIQLYEQWLQK
ncbi:plasmid mobilization protein [Segetibacter koreensis]|uniref:plasmid mobilization protein n=1 Tax=Segetibacter koreensis TaxID=398037 RepID=UPI0003717D19|nr:hypothetical protein [Segetibacter koreensis]